MPERERARPPIRWTIRPLSSSAPTERAVAPHEVGRPEEISPSFAKASAVTWARSQDSTSTTPLEPSYVRMSNPMPKAPAACGIELLEELTEAPTPPFRVLLQLYSALEPSTRPHA